VITNLENIFFTVELITNIGFTLFYYYYYYFIFAWNSKSAY